MKKFEEYLQFKLDNSDGKTKQLLAEQIASIKKQTKRNEQQVRLGELKHRNGRLSKEEILEYLKLSHTLCEEEGLEDLDETIYKIIDDENMDTVLYYLENRTTGKDRIFNSLQALSLKRENFIKLIPYLSFHTKSLDINCNFENFTLFPKALLEGMSRWQEESLAHIIAKQLAKSPDIDKDLLILEDVKTFKKTEVIKLALMEVAEISPRITGNNIRVLEAKKVNPVHTILSRIETDTKTNITELIDEDAAEFCIKTAVAKLSQSCIPILNAYPKLWEKITAKDKSSIITEAGQIFLLNNPNWEFIDTILTVAAKLTDKLALPTYGASHLFMKYDVPDCTIEKALKVKWSKSLRTHIAFSILAAKKEKKAVKITKRDLTTYIDANYKDNSELCSFLPKWAVYIEALTFCRQLENPFSEPRVTHPSLEAIEYAAEHLQVVSSVLINSKHHEWLAELPANYVEAHEGIAKEATDDNIQYLLPYKIKWQDGETNIIDYHLNKRHYRVCLKLIEKGVKPSKQTAKNIHKELFNNLGYRDSNDTQLEDLFVASLDMPHIPPIERANIKLLFEKVRHKAILKLVQKGLLSKNATYNGLPIMSHLTRTDYITEAIALGMSPLEGGTMSPMFSNRIQLEKRIEIFELYLNDLQAKATLTAPEPEVCEMDMF